MVRQGQRGQFVQESAHILQSRGYIGSSVQIFVEVDVQAVGYSVQPAYFRISGFVCQPAGHALDQPVAPMPPSPMLGNGFEHLGRCAPTAPGLLARVAVLQFGEALGEQFSAGTLIRQR